MAMDAIPSEKILLLEDDPVLGEGVVLQLELSAMTVRWCKTVREALDVYAKEGPFAMALLDVMLPDGSGTEVCERIRANDKDLPVLFMTAKTDEDSVVRGLELGANDYLRKPVGKREMIARIRNLLPSRRAQRDGWSFRDLVLLKAQRKLVFEGREIALNRREYEILSCFFQHPETVISRERFLTEIDRDGEIFDRTIDSHMSHIRTKLRKAGIVHVRIESVYGEGYRLGVS